MTLYLFKNNSWRQNDLTSRQIKWKMRRKNKIVRKKNRIPVLKPAGLIWVKFGKDFGEIR